MVTLLGPSGCGKTTTLRMISGFEYPTSGNVFIGDRDVAKIPPNKRGISMVFQSYALFPHLNIWENIAYGLRAVSYTHLLYPRENIEKLFDLGVMGMCIPKEYGGQGADPLASAICIEELSKQCASTGDIVATHNGLCCDPILTHGTEEQKAKYLPMLSTGHKVGAFALTEPNAGSDASKGQTEAKLEGDHYVMNGSKIFITNGYVADVFVVFAMTDKSKGCLLYTSRCV